MAWTIPIINPSASHALGLKSQAFCVCYALMEKPAVGEPPNVIDMDTTVSVSQFELTIDTYEVGGGFLAVCQEFPSLAGRASDAEGARETLLRNIQEHLGAGSSVQEQPFIADSSSENAPLLDTPHESMPEEHPADNPWTKAFPQSAYDSQPEERPVGNGSGGKFAMSLLRLLGICTAISIVAELATFPWGARFSPAILMSDSLAPVILFGLVVCLPASAIGLMRRIGKEQWPTWRLEYLTIPFIAMLCLQAYGKQALRDASRSQASHSATSPVPQYSKTSLDDKARAMAREGLEKLSFGEPTSQPHLVSHTPFKGLTIELPRSWEKADSAVKNAVLDQVHDSLGAGVAERHTPTNEGTVMFMPTNTPDGTNIVLFVRAQKTLTQDVLAQLTSADLQVLRPQMLAAFSKMNGLDQHVSGFGLRVSTAGNKLCIEASGTLTSGGDTLFIQTLRIPLGTKTVSMVLTRPADSNLHVSTLNLARKNLRIEE